MNNKVFDKQILTHNLISKSTTKGQLYNIFGFPKGSLCYKEYGEFFNCCGF